MERKLIKQGLGGFTIYLPKKWVSKKGLKEGDSISINETETSLVVGSAIKGKQEITIELDDQNKKDIQNILTHAYRRGFDVIRLKKINPSILKEVQAITNRLLLGMDVTEYGVNSCTLENISEPTGEKYDVLLRRIFLIIKEMQKIIVSDFKSNSFAHMSDIDSLRNQMDKFVLFCRRILTKESIERKSILEWELLTFLTHIGHSHYYLYLYASKNKPEKDSSLVIIEDLMKYFDLYYAAYFGKDMKKAHEINKLRDIYYLEKLPLLIEKGTNAMIYACIRETFRWIQLGTSPLLSELIESKFI